MDTQVNVTKQIPKLTNSGASIMRKPNEKRVFKMKGQSDYGLSIKGYALKRWLDEVKMENGAYFLDIDALSTRNRHSLQYKCHFTGELIEFDDRLRGTEETGKEFLESLILDLSLFYGTEKVIVYDKTYTALCLHELTERFYEYQDAIDSIIDRMVDLEEVFKGKIYYDSRFDDLSLDTIYTTMYPGIISRHWNLTSSYKMHQVLTVITNVFNQVIRRGVAA